MIRSSQIFYIFFSAVAAHSLKPQATNGRLNNNNGFMDADADGGSSHPIPMMTDQ